MYFPISEFYGKQNYPQNSEINEYFILVETLLTCSALKETVLNISLKTYIGSLDGNASKSLSISRALL